MAAADLAGILVIPGYLTGAAGTLMFTSNLMTPSKDNPVHCDEPRYHERYGHYRRCYRRFSGITSRQEATALAIMFSAIWPVGLLLFLALYRDEKRRWRQHLQP